MADTAKVQLVSSPTHQAPPSSPPLTPPAQEGDTSTSSDSFVELSLADDAISLQDMIDSELALRISTDTIEDDPEEEPSLEVKPLEVKKLVLLNLEVDEEDSSTETKVPGAKKPDLIDVEDQVSNEATSQEVQKVDLLNLDFSEEVSVEENVSQVDLLNLESEDVLSHDEAPVLEAFIETQLSPVAEVSIETQLSLETEEELVEQEVAAPADRTPSPEPFRPDDDVVVENGYNGAQIDSIDWEPQVVEPDESGGGETKESESVSFEPEPDVVELSDAEPFANGVDAKSPTDINTKFILAEQADQLELTEADIMFFNTFNQVQSNGDDSPVNSPDASTESPKPVAMEFDPFATIPVQDLESPVYEAPTFPTSAADQNGDTKTPVADNSSSSSGFNNSMNVFTNSNLDTKIILNNLTHPELGSDQIADVFPSDETKEEERRAIPEIGITPPEVEVYEDDDDECLTEEAGEEFDSWTRVGDVEAHDVCINAAPTSDSESSEAVTTSTSSVEKKTTKKKKSEAINGDVNKTKRNKKNKKEEKENISVKSSFSKFDALSKKTVLHVRSGDAAKAQKQFSQASAGGEVSSNCKACAKQVFVMEQVKAERCVWHKNCFRCVECSKQLTVDAYSSHEGVLYCKPHFRELFKPKAVVEDEAPVRRRKAGPIISENQPTELPPEVVRGSDKPDLGLEELSSLNVKSRFQAFEQKPDDSAVERSPSAINVKRSPSILSKLARFQAKGMDVGVTDDSLNGVPLGEDSSSEEEEEEDEEGVEREVVRANRKHRERPVSFSKMEDIKGRWESGTSNRREDRREERKLEISTIRSRLFMGHQGKMKEAYQQAVTESTTGKEAKKDVDVGSDRARSIKERFERGDVINTDQQDDEQRKLIEEDLVDAGYTKKSRSLFLELDASAAKLAPISPPKSSLGRDESFRKPREAKTPEREIYRDPTIVRADDKINDQEVIRSQTASKMLSFFKQMEETASKDEVPLGPKPLKRFTPPPDCELNRDSGSSDEGEESSEEEEGEEEEHNPDIIRSSDKVEDEFLKSAQTAAVRAKTLRAKFERWEEREVERERTERGSNVLDGFELTAEQAEQASLDTTKSLRARFESMGHETQQNGGDKQVRPKVNRFVEIQTSCAEFCASCEKKVYHLEKVETGGKIFHKNCFRCVHCNCILRMDSYTLNSGRLYCLPHFKQIFFAKGNYEEGFGIDQHKRKWASNNKSNDILLSLTAVD